MFMPPNLPWLNKTNLCLTLALAPPVMFHPTRCPIAYEDCYCSPATEALCSVAILCTRVRANNSAIGNSLRSGSCTCYFKSAVNWFLYHTIMVKILIPTDVYHVQFVLSRYLQITSSSDASSSLRKKKKTGLEWAEKRLSPERPAGKSGRSMPIAIIDAPSP